MLTKKMGTQQRFSLPMSSNDERPLPHLPRNCLFSLARPPLRFYVPVSPVPPYHKRNRGLLKSIPFSCIPNAVPPLVYTFFYCQAWGATASTSIFSLSTLHENKAHVYFSRNNTTCIDYVLMICLNYDQCSRRLERFCLYSFNFCGGGSIGNRQRDRQFFFSLSAPSRTFVVKTHCSAQQSRRTSTFFTALCSLMCLRLLFVFGKRH